jgi:hypothetical protein
MTIGGDVLGSSNTNLIYWFLPLSQGGTLESPLRVFAYVSNLFCWITAIPLSQSHDHNILPFAHTVLAFPSGLRERRECLF